MVFKELCFDSMATEKDVCCGKKAKNKSLKEKCTIIQSEGILEQ